MDILGPAPRVKKKKKLCGWGGGGLGDGIIAVAHEGANRGGGGVELRHFELLAHLPPSRGYRY